MTDKHAAGNALEDRGHPMVDTSQTPDVPLLPDKRLRNPELAAQFMIAEFNALQERAKNYDQMNANRVNFYLLAVAAVVGGLTALGDSPSFPFDYLWLAAGSFIVLLFFGLSTLQHVIDFSGAAVVMYRRAGRIRRWFSDYDRSIQDYLAFEPSDARPLFTTPYVVMRGGEAPLLVINATLAAMASGIFCYKLTNKAEASSYVVALLIGVVAWIGQQVYIRFKMQRAENSKDNLKAIKYPMPTGSIDDK